MNINIKLLLFQSLNTEFKKEDIEIGIVTTDNTIPRSLSEEEIEKELSKIGESD